MAQIALFDDTHRVVNVASVPQRSPFRYPGGKTWLIPRIRQWLSSFASTPGELVEPFAGGGIVALTVAAEHLAERVTMVELDSQIAAVWKTIIDDDGGAEWLAERIVSFDLTSQTVDETLLHKAQSSREHAFQTILRNRVNRGGIMAAGAGRIRNGEAGKGLRSRWYPVTLQRRILDIQRHADRLTFIEGDALEVLRGYTDRADAVFFIDPPYTASRKHAGSRLYSHPDIAHEELFSICASLRGDFLMTYDNADEVRLLADRFGFQTRAIAMKNTHHATMSELLVGRDLAWVG